MKPNSCLFRAVSVVVEYQFGACIGSDAFDRYNNGEGVFVKDWVKATNEALAPVGLEIDEIIGKFSGDVPFQVTRSKGHVSSPCVAYLRDEQHAIPVVGSEQVKADAAFTIRRKRPSFIGVIVALLRGK